MRLAIAGSRSLVAAALARRAAAQGWAVVRVGRAPDADLAFDAARPDNPPDLSGCDALVICAAAFGPDTAEGARENFQVNLVGALVLFEAAQRAGVGHVLLVSSTSAIEARESYGLSKAVAERQLVALSADAGLPLVVVRPSQVYDSRGEARRRQPFLYHLVARLSAGQDVTLYGTRDVARNYVHVDDLAEALMECLRARLTGTFNAVHPVSLRVSEVAETVRAGFGSAGRVAFDPGRPDLAEIAIPADDNLFARLGLAPRSFAEGVAQMRAALAEA